MNSNLVIQLFGSFDARVGGNPLPRLRSRKGQWLLTLLALRSGSEVDRTWLAGTLWPDHPGADALHSLRISLQDLRRALGDESDRLISPTRKTLRLDLDGAEVDVLEFDRAISAGDSPSLERAVSLHRGPFLEDCCEEWVFQERSPREEAYLNALQVLARHAMANGDCSGAATRLRAAVVMNPMQEAVQRALIEALGAGGRYAEATQAYRDLRELLRREMHIEPDPETTRLYQRLRKEARCALEEASHRPQPSPGCDVNRPERAPSAVGSERFERDMEEPIDRSTSRVAVSPTVETGTAAQETTAEASPHPNSAADPARPLRPPDARPNPSRFREWGRWTPAAAIALLAALPFASRRSNPEARLPSHDSLVKHVVVAGRPGTQVASVSAKPGGLGRAEHVPPPPSDDAPSGPTPSASADRRSRQAAMTGSLRRSTPALARRASRRSANPIAVDRRESRKPGPRNLEDPCRGSSSDVPCPPAPGQAGPDGAWSTVGTMQPARHSAASAVDALGRIWVIGGQVDGRATADVDVYDPATHLWSSGPALPAPRTEHSVVAARRDGRTVFYVLGGKDSSQGVLDSAAYLDPADPGRGWTPIQGLRGPRTSFGAAAAPDGRLFVAGGTTNGTGDGEVDTIEVYDPKAPAGASWQLLPSHLCSARYINTCEIVRGKLYVIGGCHYQSGEVAYLNRVEVMALDRSEPPRRIRSLGTARSTFASAVGLDGRIYIIGGGGAAANAYYASVEVYDPGAGTWSTVAPLFVARSALNAVIGRDGTIYALGGWTGSHAVTQIEALAPSRRAGSRSLTSPAVLTSCTAMSSISTRPTIRAGAKLGPTRPALSSAAGGAGATGNADRRESRAAASAQHCATPSDCARLAHDGQAPGPAL